MVMPVQKPGKSEQVVATPVEFTRAILNRLREYDFECDLAADDDNKVTSIFYDEKIDALTQPWDLGDGWNWLNPPYADIEPWVKRAWEQATQTGAKTVVLVPASTGSNWWRDWVYGKAYITYLNGRITFQGHSGPYPKDLVILLYAPYLNGGSCVWRWK